MLTNILANFEFDGSDMLTTCFFVSLTTASKHLVTDESKTLSLYNTGDTIRSCVNITHI